MGARRGRIGKLLEDEFDWHGCSGVIYQPWNNKTKIVFYYDYAPFQGKMLMRWRRVPIGEYLHNVPEVPRPRTGQLRLEFPDAS